MSAVISKCGKYRYRLDRYVQGNDCVIAYFGVNCSTADASIDDQTVKKWIGFTRINNCGRFIVGNPFAYRATDVKKLADPECIDPVGKENERYLKEIIAEADILIPCWGNVTKVPKKLRHHFDNLEKMIFDSGKPVMVFGFTKSGCPLHPMMLGYGTELIPWEK